MNKRLTKISKYLTFILRHHPDSIGMSLDDAGSLCVEELVAKANATGKSITIQQVNQVVVEHQPPLFELIDDGTRIRAI